MKKSFWKILQNLQENTSKGVVASLKKNQVSTYKCYAIFFRMQFFVEANHCVKSFRIRSYSGPYSVRMRKNTDQNNSEYGHFSRIEFARSIGKASHIFRQYQLDDIGTYFRFVKVKNILRYDCSTCFFVVLWYLRQKFSQTSNKIPQF